MKRSRLSRWGAVLVLAALPTGAARADEGTDWHEHMLATLSTAGTNPVISLSPPPALYTGKHANDLPTLCLLALFAPSQPQPPGGGSNNSVTTTVIYPVSTWSGGCMISGNLKAIITATPDTSGTASVVLKVRPMGCHGSCGMVNGHFTASTTVTIGAPVAISGTLNSNYPHCDFSHASAVCGFVVNADGTATVNSMVLYTGCFD